MILYAAGSDLWQYAERYLGKGTRSYSPFSADLDIDDAYHPQRGWPTFDVPTFRVPHELGEYLGNTIASSLNALYRTEEHFLLPVHPQTLTILPDTDTAVIGRLPAGPPITVVPSANARTVFVVAIDGVRAEPHFLKLHYPKRLSRFTRRLRRPIIGLQLWVADELTRAGLPFLPEVGGAVFGHDPREAWGYLLREPRARVGPAAPRSRTVPLFALYGRDVHAPEDPTLLEQLIIHSGELAEEYVTLRVVVPIVRLWLSAAVGLGCALEMHGQNAVFSFDSDTGDTAVVYRDCAVYVDPAMRAGLGLPDELPPTNVMGKDVPWPREQVYSLAYDSFTGHHALDFVARLVQARFGVDPERLHAAAADEFRAWGLDVHNGWTGLLPETVYYYDNQLHPDGGWRLVDTASRPLWR
jgi:hypothetical protein